MLASGTVIKALILAGGSGNELRPLTIHTPKPMLPVGNLPLLLYQIERIKRAEITEFILSISYPPRTIHSVMKEGDLFGILLRYHVESSPLGTAGAFLRAKNLIDDTTVILNGDVLAEFPLRKMLEAHKKRRAMVTIGTCQVSNPQAYGTVEVDKQGLVIKFAERPRGKEVKTNRINAGIYIVERSILKMIPKQEPCFFETGLFPQLLQSGKRVLAFDIGQDWLEITRPASYLQSNMDLLEGRIRPPRFAAYPMRRLSPSEHQGSVDDRSLIGENCVIKPGARIFHSVLGANCRIEEGALIRNSVLWPGCRIQKGAAVSGTVLGKGCQIGEGAQLRSGNILGDKSLITDFSRG